MAPEHDLEEIKRRTKARVEEEKAAYPQPVHPQIVITPEIVRKSCEANEDGDGRLFSMIYNEKLIYDHSEQEWYFWNGHFWVRDGRKMALAAFGEVEDVYLQEAHRCGAERINATKSGNKSKAEAAEYWEKALIKRVNVLRTVRRRDHVLTLASAGKERLGIAGDEWDKNPMLLGCNNGVIELISGELHPGRPNDFIQTASPTNYDPKATAHRFIDFVHEIFDGDTNKVMFLQRLLGYGITGLSSEGVLPIFIGDGRNGKGTLFDHCLFPVLGSLAGSIQAEAILDPGRVRSADAPSPSIMALRGRRIVRASETGQGVKLDAAKAKLLSGEDKLTGRWPHSKRQIEFEPTHLLILLTNFKPRLPANDYAVWKRVALLTFPLSFVPDPKESFERKRDSNLTKLLAKEHPGILRWIVDGCLMWQREGLNPPPCVLADTLEYKREEDIIGHFIEEKCYIDTNASTTAANIYEAYCEWAKDNGYRPMSAKTFGSQIGKTYERKKSHGKFIYNGIGILSE